MPTNILLVTVHHTGTRFFLRLLMNALGEQWQGIGNQAIEQGRLDLADAFFPFAAIHLEPENLIYIERYISNHKPLILTTERKRENTKASWKRRGRWSVERLDCCFLIEDWFRWKYNPLVLSVDSPTRERRLRQLSKMLSVELVTNWEPVGSTSDP